MKNLLTEKVLTAAIATTCALGACAVIANANADINRREDPTQEETFCDMVNPFYEEKKEDTFCDMVNPFYEEKKEDTFCDMINPFAEGSGFANMVNPFYEETKEEAHFADMVNPFYNPVENNQ